MSVLATVGVGWVVMSAAMALLWLIVWRRNAGYVDVAWSLGTGVLAVAFALTAEGGYHPRRLLVAALACIWAIRLGGYLLRRVAGEPEDGRYQALRRDWGARAPLYLFVFFQVQAIWAVMFSAPMLIAARNPRPGIVAGDLIGVLIAVVAIVGESLADRQLARFRSDPASRGRVCQVGLWRYSRHPNYFFEWLHWFAYVAIGFAAPWGWLTLAGPVVMYVFITRVTGIPPTEARAIESRGDAYREYQRTTSAFVPWPRERRLRADRART